MALDPRVIAALSAGAKTSATYQPREYEAEGAGGAWNLGQSIIDVLSTGGYATAGLTNKIGQNFAAIGRGEIGAAADLVNPLSGVDAMVRGVSDRRTYSQNLQELGVDRNASVWLGLALDIGLDPTTYITGGTLAGVKGAAQGAKLAAAASKGGSTIVKSGEVAGTVDKTNKALLGLGNSLEASVPLGRPLTESEKLGNLLTGISRGYQTGKNQYKLSIKGNKLQKIRAKQAKKADEVRGVVEVGSTFSKLPTGSDSLSTVQKVSAKEKKAAEKYAKAKAKVDASALPGVTAGLSKATAAKIASDAARVVSTVEKLDNGLFGIVVRSPEGQVLEHRFAKKTYKSEASAKKSADIAAREVEEKLRGQASLDTQVSPASAEAADETTRTALRPAEGNARDARIRAEFAEGSKQRRDLNILVKSLARPGVFRQTRELDETDSAKLEAIKEAFLDRIDDFRQAEQTAIKVTPNQIGKATVDELIKYTTTPASKAVPNELFDRILDAVAVVPEDFTALQRALASERVAPGEATIYDLINVAVDTENTPAAIQQAREAFVLSRLGMEESAAVASTTLKPWIDGIVTPMDAEDAVRAMVDLIYADLKKSSRAYKVIVKALTDALEGKLKAVAGSAEKPLTADEVEDVFNAFISGNDISRAIEKLGRIDLEKMSDETYNTIDELAADLQDNKIKLSETFKRDLSFVLGVPTNIVQASFVKVFGNVDGLGRVLTDDALTLGKGIITSTDAATATGNTAGQAAAAAADATLDASRVEDIAQQAADIAAPMPATNVSAEATAELVSMREVFATEAQQALNDLATKAGFTDRQVRSRITGIVRDNMLPSIRDQIKSLAKKRGLTLEQALDEVLAGDLRVITEDPASFTVGGALKLDELGSHGRIDMFNRIIYASKGSVYKGTNANALANREALNFYAIETALRSLGIPVRSTESAAAALRREGVKAGTKKAKSVKPQYSSVTWADILRQMIDKNQQGLAFELRRIRGEANKGYSYGNFLPTSIEAAWLTVKRYKEAGVDFEKGSENYEEILFALNNKEVRGGKFDLAPHAEYAKQTPAAAGQIERISDDLIKFLSDNYDALKEVDSFREGLIIGANAQAVYSQSVEVFAGMIRFSGEFTQLKESFKAGDLADAQLTESLGQLLGRYNNLFERLSTGSFSDRKLAENMAGMYKSMIINADIPGASKVKPFVQEMTNIIATVRATDKAYAAAKAAGKSEKAAETAGKSARTTQKRNNLEQDVQITAEQLARSSAADVPTPAASEAAETAVQETVSLNNAFAKIQTRWTRVGKAMSGNYGMGASFKTILSSSEQSAISYSHWFSLGIRAIKSATRGREADVQVAFKALQDYRKELAAADELGEAISLDDFLANYGQVDREIFDSLSESFDILLGADNVFGAAKSLSIMKSELNQALRQFGLSSIQVGDAKTFDDFWLEYSPELFPDRSPLEFINLLNLAVHRAAARVEIASQFDQFVGKTAKEIADLGENINDYVKIDTDTSIGQLLGDTNKFVHRDDAERLKYVQRYLDYDQTFSEGALSRVVEVADRVTYVLKSTNTLLRPGHHVTSIVGEAAMNALAGVRLSSYNNTARILNRFRPGQYENAGEPFKAYAELIATKGKRIKADEFDNIYWINPQGKREILPDEIVYQLAERWGVLVHPGGSLEDFMVSSDSVLKGAYAKFHQGMNGISVLASHRDNFFRLTHFIDELQKTTGAKNVEEAALAAATAIREWHPTAGSLSAFEKKYARRFVYFYTWQRVALTKVVATMLERPGIVTIPSKIQYAFADANGFNPESFGDPWDPDGIYASWHTGQMWGPQFQGPAGEGDAWGVQPAIQPVDVLGQIFKPFTLQPGANPIDSMAQGANDLFAANMNPVLKTLIESSTQNKLGTGEALPGPAEYLLGQIGVISTLSKVTGIGQDPNPYQTDAERAENNARLITNLLLGQRLTDYSTPATQYKWTLDQQDIMRRMAGQ